MIRKDYIMRMVEQLARCLAKILFNKNAGEFKEAAATIETAFRTILGIDSRLFEALSAHDIGELLGISMDLATGGMKCIVAARLLKEKAQIREFEGADDASVVRLYLNSLSLYLDGIASMKCADLDLSGYCGEAGDIVNRVGNSLPSDMRLRVEKLIAAPEASGTAENME